MKNETRSPIQRYAYAPLWPWSRDGPVLWQWPARCWAPWSYPFQRLAAKQQRLRDERIAAYTAFASAVEDFRWGQAERYFSKQRDPGGEAYQLAYQEGHRLRTTAWQAFYRIKLVTNDASLVAHAEAALEQTRSVSGAANDSERDQLDDVAKAAIRDFVDYASKHVQ
jgi:hypothetical protein